MIGILLGLAHMPLLVMDGIYWDDWILRHFIVSGDKAAHVFHWQERGLPVFSFFHWIIGGIGNPAITHNLLTFALIITSSVLMFLIAKTLQVSDWEAWLIVISADMVAAVETMFLFSTTVYLLMFTLFLLAVFLALRNTMVTRIMALLLFSVSFQLHSLLVYYAAFLLLRARQKKSLGTFLRTSMDFLLLPVAYWFIKTEFFVVALPYYNKFDWSLASLRLSTVGFLREGLVAQVSETVYLCITHPVAWVFTICIAVVLALYRGNRINVSTSSTVAWVGFGVMLFVLGAAPYVLVGKPPSAHGYATRHALLIALPIGVFVTAVVRVFLRFQYGKYIASVVLATIVCGGTISHWQLYAGWQERWIKDQSVIAYFAAHPELQSIGTYTLDDDYPLTTESYRFYEWSAMFREAWNVSGYLVLMENERFEQYAWLDEHHVYWREWYNVTGYPRNSCQATLRIAPRNVNVLAYVTARLLKDERRLQTLIQEATTITVIPDADCA